MRIKLATMTGADDNTDPNMMVEISKEFPFVEWGILFRKDKMETGIDRYPSLAWVQDKLWPIAQQHSLNLSAHICGAFITEMFRGESTLFNQLNKHILMFQRMQLNFQANYYKVDEHIFIDELQRLSDLYSFTHQINNPSLTTDPPLLHYIFQYNTFENNVLYRIAKYALNASISPLYDASGGRGQIPQLWGSPLNSLTGYAGGLTPDNISNELQRIFAMSDNSNVDMWVDLETGIRTDNKLDYDKVISTLRTVNFYREVFHVG